MKVWQGNRLLNRRKKKKKKMSCSSNFEQRRSTSSSQRRRCRSPATFAFRWAGSIERERATLARSPPQLPFSLYPPQRLASYRHLLRVRALSFEQLHFALRAPKKNEKKRFRRPMELAMRSHHSPLFFFFFLLPACTTAPPLRSGTEGRRLKRRASSANLKSKRERGFF